MDKSLVGDKNKDYVFAGHYIRGRMFICWMIALVQVEILLYKSKHILS